MDTKVLNEYVNMLNVIASRSISQEEFKLFYKRSIALRKIKVKNPNVVQVRLLLEGMIYNYVSRFDYSYSRLKLVNPNLLNDLTRKVFEWHLKYAREGSEFIDAISNINEHINPWYSCDPITVPMYNYFLNLDALNEHHHKVLTSTSKELYSLLNQRKQQLADAESQLNDVELKIQHISKSNNLAIALFILGIFLSFLAPLFIIILITPSLFFIYSNTNEGDELHIKKNELKKLVKEQRKGLKAAIKNFSKMIMMPTLSVETTWDEIYHKINQLRNQLKEFVPKVTYTSGEVIELRTKRIKTIKDLLKKQLGFKSSKLLKAPVGFTGKDWQDELLTMIEPLHYQSAAAKIIEKSSHYRYMQKSNVLESRLVDNHELMFSTNVVQTIYLFENKLGILTFVYDLISDQMIHDSYEEIYYRHITAVDTETIIIKGNFAKKLVIRTSAKKEIQVNFINKEDYVHQAQLKLLEEQRERLKPSRKDDKTNSTSTENSTSTQEQEIDLLDEFNLDVSDINEEMVQTQLKEIDEKITKLKEKPFMKDIQGLDLSRDTSHHSQIADRIASMVTAAIESHLDSIQVSQIDQV